MSGTKVVQTHNAYSKPEELTNFITFAVAAALSFAGLVFLLVQTGINESGAIACVAVFAFAAVCVFLFGTLGHILPPPARMRAVCRKAEHCAVAALVAGAFAPVLLIGMPSGTYSDAVWGYALYAVIAVCTAVAFAINIARVPEYKIYSLLLYVIIGMACVVRIGRIVELCGWDLFWWLFCGGAAYFTGAVVCSFDALPARHLLWHITVVCGAALHFVGLYTFVL